MPESFQAGCGTGEVLVIQTALYGHIRLGKCVRHDLGFLGCTTDATGIMDDLCSGRNACETVNVANIFEHTRVCDGLEKYMEVSHTCVRGKASTQPCNVVAPGCLKPN